jgi:hypothetical protein
VPLRHDAKYILAHCEKNDSDKKKSKGVLYPAAQLIINKDGQLEFQLNKNHWRLISINRLESGRLQRVELATVMIAGMAVPLQIATDGISGLLAIRDRPAIPLVPQALNDKLPVIRVEHSAVVLCQDF